jgi:hypothetical protein
MNGHWGLVVAFVLSLRVASIAAELPAEVVQRTFYPYAETHAPVAGLAPGTQISKDSWEPAQGYLPPEILDRVKAGELAFAVQETTDLPVSEAYIDATKRHADQVKIGADGELDGYVAGLPFPVLDPKDSQVGLKAAWNLRHRDFADTVQIWNTFRLLPESGTAEREFENYYVIAYGMHRPQTSGVNPNRWEQDGVLYKEFSHMLNPFDVKNTMTLKLRYDRDRDNDDNWLYSPSSRKIRKVIVKLDEASYDSGFLNEDFFGYWSYIRACQWQLIGTPRLLAPMGAKVQATTFGGRGNWYPVDPWELRDMLALQCTPTATGHLYSKRMLYIDRQTFTPVYVLFYDSEGKHEKTLFELYGNPKHNPGNEHVRFPVWIGETMIDYRTAMASMTMMTKVSYENSLPDNFFNPDKIVARGQ